jgi:acyl-CoA thioester hydrolase
MIEQAQGIGRWSESRLRVRYCETDAMGVAHHAEYLAWYEVARTDWIREGSRPGNERSYRRLERAGYLLPVVELHCRYAASARYDDELIVRACMSDATRARITFAYEILRAEDGLVLTTGTTVHAVVGPDGRPRRMPQPVLDWLLHRAGPGP